MPWTAEAFLATNPWTDATYLSERQHLANSELTATQLADFLSYYQRQAIETAARLATTTTTYIHPLPLSFPTETNKSNYINKYSDCAQLETYQRLWKCAPGSSTSNVWVGFFSTWTETWVGRRKANTPWHAWSAALIRCGSGGRHLLFWDCDINLGHDITGLRPREVLLGTQVKLLELARQKGSIVGVWIGGGVNSGQNRCLQLATEWVSHIAGFADEVYAEGDARLIGFQKLDKK